MLLHGAFSTEEEQARKPTLDFGCTPIAFRDGKKESNMEQDQPPTGQVQVSNRKGWIFFFKTALAVASAVMKIVHLYHWVHSWFDHSKGH